MKGVNTWSFRPYIRPIDDVYKLTEPYEIHICRIAPSVASVAFDWIKIRETDEKDGEYTVYYKKTTDRDFIPVRVNARTCELTKLMTDTDYEFYVTCAAGRSRVRLARTGFVPGTTVNYLHPADEAFKFSGWSLCSPSVVKHPEGWLLASMDVFGGGTPQNLSFVYRSDDNGVTWYYVCDLFPCFWGKLFVHRSCVYILAMSTEYGDVLIGRYDGRNTFCMPTVIARGSCSSRESGFHRAPMPINEYGGRLWTSIEYGAWAKGIHAMSVLSADAKGDLLDPLNWTISEPLPYDPEWKGTSKGKSAGCIEGNMIAAPDGRLYNILRYQTNGCEPSYGRVMVLSADPSDPEKRLAFDRVIDFPGNLSKFDIVYDTQSKKYRTICSRILNAAHAGSRNVLSLASSDDLFKWQTDCDLLDYRDSDPQKTGFQYVSFYIDGDDLVYLCRTALNGARNFHDANYSTFHIVKEFRKATHGDTL